MCAKRARPQRGGREGAKRNEQERTIEDGEIGREDEEDDKERRKDEEDEDEDEKE